jgi:hypothetical protein
MQIIKSVRTLVFLLLPVVGFSQSSYLPLGGKEYNLLERLEIKTGNANLYYNTLKPLNRRLITREVEKIDSMYNSDTSRSGVLTDIDKYNIDRYLLNNIEWATPRESFNSKKPILKHFYKTPANFFEVHEKDFFLAVNPVIQYQQMFEKGNSQSLFYNSRGVSLRGLIGEKVAFDVYVTDNQERDPLYVQRWIQSHNAVPGARYYKNFKAAGGVDYFDNRASVSINASKYVDIQLGYDKNFIGDGYRSLFLSDFSGNALFLKLNTRIWKFNYQNLFMELIPDVPRVGGNALIPRKYFRMNHLSFNATKWLNVGIFDAVMFGRKDHFDFQYLIPVLFLRPAESDIGSGDNAVFGVNFKANVKKKVQVYGQFLFDEFLLKEIVKTTGYWANKFGYQLGLKYPDAFSIKNLDLQLENNRLRPFTYSHFDNVSNYTHFNQPFAHPLGANFNEFIGLLKYQPIRKLFLQAKLISFKQGLDSGTANYGSDIFKSYETRSGNYGFDVGSGVKVRSNNLSLLASYEVKENLFLDASFQNRTYNVAGQPNMKTTVVSFGFRWNAARRNFDF